MKIFMLKQILVFQQGQEEAPFSGHELLQAGEGVTIDVDPLVALAQIVERCLKILFSMMRSYADGLSAPRFRPRVQTTLSAGGCRIH